MLGIERQQKSGHMENWNLLVYRLKEMKYQENSRFESPWEKKEIGSREHSLSCRFAQGH